MHGHYRVHQPKISSNAICSIFGDKYKYHFSKIKNFIFSPHPNPKNRIPPPGGPFFRTHFASHMVGIFKIDFSYIAVIKNLYFWCLLTIQYNYTRYNRVNKAKKCLKKQTIYRILKIGLPLLLVLFLRRYKDPNRIMDKKCIVLESNYTIMIMLLHLTFM